MSASPSHLTHHIKKVEMLLGDTNRSAFSQDKSLTTVANLRLCLVATINQKLDEMTKSHYLAPTSPKSPAFKLPGMPVSAYPRLNVKHKSVVVSLEIFDFILQSTRAMLFTDDVCRIYGELPANHLYDCYSTYALLSSEYRALHVRTPSDAAHSLTSSMAALTTDTERSRLQFRTGANRDVAYAKLCGYTAGELRAASCGTYSSSEAYKQHGFCVCPPSCKCTKHCNKQPVRACPCQLRIDTAGIKTLDAKIDKCVSAIELDERALPLTLFRARASEAAKLAIVGLVAAGRNGVGGRELLGVYRGLLRGFHRRAEWKWPVNGFQLGEGVGKRGASSPLEGGFGGKRVEV
jgi:hypothetical protein